MKKRNSVKIKTVFCLLRDGINSAYIKMVLKLSFLNAGIPLRPVQLMTSHQSK